MKRIIVALSLLLLVGAPLTEAGQSHLRVDATESDGGDAVPLAMEQDEELVDLVVLPTTHNHSADHRELADFTLFTLMSFDTNLFNNIANAISSTVLPGVVNSVNSGSLSQTLTFSISSSGYTQTVTVATPTLQPISSSTVSFKLQQNPSNPDLSMRFALQIGQLTIKLSSIKESFTNSTTGNTCTATWSNVGVTTSGGYIYIDLIAQGTQLTSQVSLALNSDASATLPSYSTSGTCPSGINSLFDASVSTLKSNLQSQVNTAVQNAVSSFQTALKSGNTVPFPPSNFSIGNGELFLSFNFNKFGVSGSRGLISLSTKMSGEIVGSPAWRIGRSFSPGLVAGGPGSFSNDQTLNINLYESALNELLQTAWYLSWAGLTSKPLSALSGKPDLGYTDPVLCNAVYGDPCPFPPIQLEFSRFQSLPLKLVFNFLQSQFRRNGLFSSFQVNVHVIDPTITIEATGLGGGATAVFYILGKGVLSGRLKKLLVLTIPIELTVQTPGLSSSGQLQNLRVLSFELHDFTFDYKVVLPPRLDRRLFYRFALDIVNQVSANFLGTLNKALDGALGGFQLPFTSLPFGPLTLSLAISNTVIQPVVGDESYLGISAGLTISS